MSLTIAELGFPGAAADAYRRCLRAPHGLVLVVGIRGSGISTTLAAGLRELAGSDASRRLIRIEDRVEEILAGVTHVALDPRAGFHASDAIATVITAADAPGVLAISGIRDRTTAEQVLRLSRSWLVIGGMFCEHASDAARQLADIGVDPVEVDRQLLAVFAQRLESGPPGKPIVRVELLTTERFAAEARAMPDPGGPPCLLDQIEATSRARRAEPTRFFEEFLEGVWWGNTEAQAMAQWTVQVEQFPWYAEDALYAMDAVIAKPPETLVALVERYAGLAVEPGSEALTVCLQWVQQVRERFGAIYDQATLDPGATRRPFEL